MTPNTIAIVNYTTQTKEAIKLLNYEWLLKYFTLEPSDIQSLNNPDEEIIAKGGYIYYATLNGAIVGTASLLKITATQYELGKMAVTEAAKGSGIGTLLLQHCIEQAALLGVQSLILYSNTKLASAIHLYKKYGFVEVALQQGLYQRANIKMEKKLP